MRFSAKQAQLNDLARGIYDWAAGGGANPSTHRIIREVFGSSIGEDALVSVRGRMQSDGAFGALRHDLVSRWRKRMASHRPLSEAEARAFIGELSDSFDHALLYDHGLIASSTYMQRGETSSRDMRMPGTMPCWTLHFTTRGGALFLSRDTEQAVGAGSVMLMRPQAVYHYGLHPRESEWEHLWAIFQPRANWAELLEWNGPNRELSHLQLADASERDRIESLFRALIALGAERGTYRQELQHNKLEELLLRVRGCVGGSERRPLDLRIQRACDYMLARLDHRISIDEVARELSLSASRFAHLFKAQLGVGPKTWLNDQRLQRARKLLLQTADSVAAIGARVGYEDPSHFTRYFSKSMGCSPREFRRTFGGSAEARQAFD
tara:strand:+ start:31656 stop:32795 length:1140 start_codon:yes stop_codon:yes gene_type:complete